MREYRIVRDAYAGYEVQEKRDDGQWRCPETNTRFFKFECRYLVWKLRRGATKRQRSGEVVSQCDPSGRWWRKV